MPLAAVKAVFASLVLLFSPADVVVRPAPITPPVAFASTAVWDTVILRPSLAFKVILLLLKVAVTPVAAEFELIALATSAPVIVTPPTPL